MALHNILGKQGEDYAVNYLQHKGYRVLDRNWKCGDMEIDIVALDNEELVFIEVKTRSSDAWQNPVDAVDELRKRRLSRAANAYIKYHKLDNRYRFDIIGIIMNASGTSLNHVEEAFTLRPRFIGPRSMCPESRWSKSYWKKRR